MTDPDEYYGGDLSPRQQQTQQTQQTQQQQQTQSGQYGIAGLDMNIGPIAAPSAAVPYVQPRVWGGPVVPFPWRQSQRSPSPIRIDDNEDDADIDFAALAGVVGDDPDNEAIARAVASQTVRQQIAAAQPEESPITQSNVDQVVSSILNPRPRDQQQQQQQQQRHQEEQLFRHREMITAILRECPNIRMNRLIRFILSIERYTVNSSRLRERLLQLERMLRMNRRTRSRLNVTVSHSAEFMRAFRRLVAGCSSARARRAFYALISRLREQVVHRLAELNERRTRRVFTQPPQPPQPPQPKGGKRKTRKMSTNRNKTIRISHKK